MKVIITCAIKIIVVHLSHNHMYSLLNYVSIYDSKHVTSLRLFVTMFSHLPADDWRFHGRPFCVIKISISQW